VREALLTATLGFNPRPQEGATRPKQEATYQKERYGRCLVDEGFNPRPREGYTRVQVHPTSLFRARSHAHPRLRFQSALPLGERGATGTGKELLARRFSIHASAWKAT
jgi:hypothetical protein